MAKEKVLTDLQKAFLTALLGDARGDFKLAKKLAGYADTVSVAEIMKSLKNEIREAAKDALAMASVQASFALTGAMLDPNAQGTGNIIKAAESILNRVGVKEEDSVSSLPDGAVLILPEKKVTIITVGEKDAS
jgi:hypothetical protein